MGLVMVMAVIMIATAVIPGMTEMIIVVVIMTVVMVLVIASVVIANGIDQGRQSWANG